MFRTPPADHCTLCSQCVIEKYNPKNKRIDKNEVLTKMDSVDKTRCLFHEKCIKASGTPLNDKCPKCTHPISEVEYYGLNPNKYERTVRVIHRNVSAAERNEVIGRRIAFFFSAICILIYLRCMYELNRDNNQQ